MNVRGGLWAASLVVALMAAGGSVSHEEVLRRTGGLVSREGCGLLLLVNRQSRVPTATVMAKGEYLSRLLGIRVEVGTESRPAEATVVLAEGEVPSAWRRRGVGVVDMSALGEDRPEKGFDAAFARVAAELFVPKGCDVKVGRDEIEAVFRGDSFTVAAAGEVKRLLPRAGFLPATVATYRTACREGWAPPPTNDMQRAIWQHALSEKERGPTNPITIQPPGRGRSKR